MIDTPLSRVKKGVCVCGGGGNQGQLKEKGINKLIEIYEAPHCVNVCLKKMWPNIKKNMWATL